LARTTRRRSSSSSSGSGSAASTARDAARSASRWRSAARLARDQRPRSSHSALTAGLRLGTSGGESLPAAIASIAARMAAMPETNG
jgi:hypothetical protein